MSGDIKTILIASDKEKLSHQSVMALVIIFLASLIDGLDASIVTVALPKMSEYFGTSISDSSWFIFAYVVGLAAFLLPLGKMAKNNRIRKFMILGTALFGFSSFMCGISEMFWMLVAFRLLQGISAAMMSCVLPSMVVHMLPADRKGLGMSVMGASTGIALILGPVLGGLITTYTTWHWLFFINIPICLIIIFLSTKNIPKDDEPDKEKDPTVIGGISAMILVGSLLTMMEDLGDPDINTIGRIVCGILVTVSLPVLIWSIRKDRNRAIIAPKVIYNKEYLLVGASFLLCTIVVAGAQYLLPYVLQGYWGMSPMESSLYLSTISVAMVITVTPVGRMCDSIGCKFPAAMAVTLRSMFCIAMIIIAAAEADAFFLIPAYSVLQSVTYGIPPSSLTIFATVLAYPGLRYEGFPYSPKCILIAVYFLSKSMFFIPEFFTKFSNFSRKFFSASRWKSMKYTLEPAMLWNKDSKVFRKLSYLNSITPYNVTVSLENPNVSPISFRNSVMSNP